MMLKYLVLPLALLCAACAGNPLTTQPAGTTSPLPGASAAGATGVAGVVAKAQGIAVTDLNDAEADAVANNDVIAQPCYPALVTWIDSLNTSGLAKPPAGAGVFYAQQRLRDLNAASSSLSIPAPVKLACAALFVDDATFVAKADAFLGAAVASGGASVIPSLGLAPPLPIALTPAGATVAVPLP